MSALLVLKYLVLVLKYPTLGDVMCESLLLARESPLTFLDFFVIIFGLSYFFPLDSRYFLPRYLHASLL